MGMFGYQEPEPDDGIPSQELLDTLNRVLQASAVPKIDDGSFFTGGALAGSPLPLPSPYPGTSTAYQGDAFSGGSIAVAANGDPNMRWFGTHYCGPGGGGSVVNSLDEACRQHDLCYDANGLSLWSNFDPRPNPALQQCNQKLCDAVKNQGWLGWDIRRYFKNAPMPYNACRWDR